MIDETVKICTIKKSDSVKINRQRCHKVKKHLLYLNCKNTKKIIMHNVGNSYPDLHRHTYMAGTNGRWDSYPCFFDTLVSNSNKDINKP